MELRVVHTNKMARRLKNRAISHNMVKSLGCWTIGTGTRFPQEPAMQIYSESASAAAKSIDLHPLLARKVFKFQILSVSVKRIYIK